VVKTRRPCPGSARVVTAVLALLLLGQGKKPHSSGFLEPAFGSPVGPYRFGVAVQDARIVAGHEIRIMFFFENLSEEMIVLPTDAVVDYSYSLVDERGVQMPMTRFAQRFAKRRTSAGGLGTQPGSAVPLHPVRLDILVDTTLAGRYRLRATRIIRQGGTSIRVPSGEVSFEIAESP